MGLCEVSFAKRFKTPDGIARRVSGLWILTFPAYFNCCPFLLNTPNYESTSGDQLISISRKGNLSFAAI